MKAALVLCILLNVSSLYPQEDSMSGERQTANAGEMYSAHSIAFQDGQKKERAVQGTVVAFDTKEPIVGAKVSAVGTTYSTLTGADGQFMLAPFPKGYYQLKAEADGYSPDIKNNVFVPDYATEPRVEFFYLHKKEVPPPDFVEVEKQPVPMNGFTFAPQYPDQARKNGTEGTVWVKIWIDEKGVPKETQVMKSENEIFNQPSIDAAMKWKFEPAILKGKPVAVWVTIPFKFKLDAEKHQPKSETKKK